MNEHVLSPGRAYGTVVLETIVCVSAHLVSRDTGCFGQEFL